MTYTKEFKEVVNFEYSCYNCGAILSRAKICIDHVRRVHGYELPVRGVGQNRPANPEYEFQNDPKGEYDVQHYACPSCWFHCHETGLREFKEHVEEEHHPKLVDTDKATTTTSTVGKESTAEQTRAMSEHRGSSARASDEEEPQEDTEQEDDYGPKIEGAIREEVNEAFKKLNEITEMFKNLLKK